MRDELRREAQTARPEFSETLHEKIWRAVQQCKAPSEVTAFNVARAPRPLRWGLAVATAASLLLAVFAWQAAENQAQLSSAVPRNTNEEKTRPSTNVDEDSDLQRVAELTGGATETVDTWLDAALAEQRWAYLDHDAKAILEAVTSGLPFSLASIESSEEPIAGSRSARAID